MFRSKNWNETSRNFLCHLVKFFSYRNNSGTIYDPYLHVKPKDEEKFRSWWRKLSRKKFSHKDLAWIRAYGIHRCSWTDPTFFFLFSIHCVENFANCMSDEFRRPWLELDLKRISVSRVSNKKIFTISTCWNFK